MASRIELQHVLENILGSKNVYFQPPESMKLKYPCIKYNIDGIDTKYADDTSYLHKYRYTLTVIDRDPDSKIHEKLMKLPHCKFDRPYIYDNLNHFVLTIYY